MSLPSAHKDSVRPTMRISWFRQDGTPVELTSSTLSGRIHNTGTGATKSVTGVLTVVDATEGKFTWVFSTADVDTSGNFLVQFKALYPDTTFEYSVADHWEVIAPL